jgi:drug/metabolite transporter (DMT)-like permease
MDKAMLAGDLAVLAAVLVWGGNAIYTKRIIGAFHPSQITLYPVAISAPLFLLTALFLDQQMIRHVDNSILLAMFYQTFVTASLGLIGWTVLIKKFGATTLHSFIFIMPISGVFFGVVMLGEPLTVNLIGSIVLVTVGLIIVNRSSRGLMQKRYFSHIFPGKH